MASVSIRGLCKDKPSALGKGGLHRILHEISMEIADGEFLVLVGPSGCGKTTLLRCIAGLEEPSAGELQIDRQRMNEVAPQSRDIAMVFQSYALYPHMTVYDNLSFGLKMRNTPPGEIKKLVEEAANMLEIGHLLSRYPRELSGGQRQRVAMGRAVVRRPKAFLFDEPLSNLDAALRQQMRLELLRLHRRLKATMIYVTHDQVEAMTLADRIAILRQGRIEQMGSPSQLYDQPVNTFVARFFGTPEMNLIDGKMEDGWFVADGIPFRVHLPGYESQPVTLGVRAGKRMARRVSEIAITFKQLPHALFSGPMGKLSHEPNVLTLRIQPDEGITLKFLSKVPGPTIEPRPVTMDFRYGTSFGIEPPEAYERLLLDCMLGDGTLFARGDEVMASWKYCDRVLSGWAERDAHRKVALPSYEPGTWGPEASANMLARDGRVWRRP